MTAHAVADRSVRRVLALGVTISAAVAGVLVVTGARWGPDWPAQEFRAWIAAHDGLSAWTARWYGGSALPGYSILYPPLSKVIGAGGVGLAAVVLAAWASAGLAPRGRVRTTCYAAGVVVGLVEPLLIGQVPFLLGTAFGVMAFRALVHHRNWGLVLALAALSSLATPLTGAFLLLALPACAVSVGTRRSLALTGGLVGPAVALVVGGANGPFPMPWQMFASTVAFAVLMAVLSPSGHRGLRVFAVCYLVATVVLFLVPNPVGGNIARLGKLVAMPLACHYLVVDRLWLRVRAALVAALAVIWPTVPFVGSVVHGAGDPSRSQQFYSGMLGYLTDRRFGSGRLEIPFTREHWEAFWVATSVPIARGWERQTDYLYNKVLYEPLTAERYRRWLSANAVHYVALPDVPIDAGGAAEAKLLAHPPSYLEPVWHDANWQVWRVRDPTPLVTGAARLDDLDASSLILDFRRAGTAEVRIRYGPLWHVTAGTACVSSTVDGWMRVDAGRPERVDLSARLDDTVLTGPSGC